jgi:hypothetical protein
MDKKELIEKKFQEMIEKAKLIYPDMEKTLTTMTNVVSQTYTLQNYFDLTNQIPTESSNNHVTIK